MIAFLQLRISVRTPARMEECVSTMPHTTCTRANVRSTITETSVFQVTLVCVVIRVQSASVLYQHFLSIQFEHYLV